MPCPARRKDDDLSYSHLQVAVSLESVSKQVAGSLLLDILGSALTGLYGVIGGAVLIDVINFDKNNGAGIIRCRQSDKQRVLAAAGFLTHYKGSPCRLEVMEVNEQSGDGEAGRQGKQ